MSQVERRELIRDLKDRLRRLERAGRRARDGGRPVTSTGLEALDRLLPGGGLEAGTLLEWLSDGDGSGAATLALVLAARVLDKGGAFVVIDGPREFYPPAAAGLGIPLGQTVVVQPKNARDALWALEQSLRSPAVAAALGWIDRLDDRSFRRLQLAAEAGGSLGFLLRPGRCRAGPSWAEARLLVAAGGLAAARRTAKPPAKKVQSPGWRLRVELLHGQGGAGGEALELELSDAAGDVRLAAGLADPEAPPRAARA